MAAFRLTYIMYETYIGGVPNVACRFQKCQCPLSIFYVFPVGFKIVQCRVSNLRKCCVALSDLRVKGP